MTLLVKALINSIYLATEGEGVHIGHPQVFVRFQGCNIGCVNCDSIDTWEFDERYEQDLNKVVASVVQAAPRLKRVSITGGDPLHPKNVPAVIEIVKRLKRRGYWINIEAAGTRVVDEIFDLIDFISFDVKTPSTKVNTNIKLLKRMIEQYPGRFQIKSVIESDTDFDHVMKVSEELESIDFPWVLTPAFNLNEEFPFERVQRVIELNEKVGGMFRVITQQHKVIHGPDKKQI